MSTLSIDGIPSQGQKRQGIEGVGRPRWPTTGPLAKRALAANTLHKQIEKLTHEKAKSLYDETTFKLKEVRSN